MLVIDAFKKKDVAVVAYLHAEWPKDKKALLKLKDNFVDMMCNVNQKYKKYVIME